MKIKTIVFAAALAALAAEAANAPARHRDDSFSRRGRNVDDVLLSPLGDAKIGRKEPGVLFHRRDRSPAPAQMAAAGAAFSRGDYAGACGLYDTVVRSYPYGAEAPRAQENLAKILERRGKYARAFEEYRYLLHFYPESAPADDILTHMLAIANWHLGRGSRKAAVKCFAAITALAPGWRKAPDAYFAIGLAQLAEKNYYESADAFDTISTEFPDCPLAAAAVGKQSLALYALSLRNREDEAVQRRALALAVAALRDGAKDSPDRATIAANLDDLTARRDARAFAVARFYDTGRFQPETRAAAYEDFLRKCPLAPQAGEARRRIAAIRGEAEGSPRGGGAAE